MAGGNLRPSGRGRLAEWLATVSGRLCQSRRSSCSSSTPSDQKPRGARLAARRASSMSRSRASTTGRTTGASWLPSGGWCRKSASPRAPSRRRCATFRSTGSSSRCAADILAPRERRRARSGAQLNWAMLASGRRRTIGTGGQKTEPRPTRRDSVSHEKGQQPAKVSHLLGQGVLREGTVSARNRVVPVPRGGTIYSLPRGAGLASRLGRPPSSPWPAQRSLATSPQWKAPEPSMAAGSRAGWPASRGCSGFTSGMAPFGGLARERLFVRAIVHYCRTTSPTCRHWAAPDGCPIAKPCRLWRCTAPAGSGRRPRESACHPLPPAAARSGLG